MKLAAQTLSSSVASALEFLKNEGHPDFADADGTIKFIRVIDRLFDLLNSRNPHATGFKRPLRRDDSHMWGEVIDSSVKYLSSLKTTDGVPLIKTRRQTFVQGFILAATSMKKMATFLLTAAEVVFHYILTYKFSQDHLELLFSCIRSLNGYCDNPTVSQFVSALKKILLRASIMASKHANCITFEADESPSIFSLDWKKRQRKEPTPDDLVDDDDELILALDMSTPHSVYKQNILTYIGGRICRTMREHISCDICKCALFASSKNDNMYNLTKVKDNGGLLYPSHNVIGVLSVAENVFKQFRDGNMMASKYLRTKMRVRVTQELYDSNIFKSLHQHDVLNHEPSGGDMHSTQLIKQITEKYLNIRLFRHMQTHTDDVVRKGKLGKRQELTKAMIFQGI